MPDQPGKGPPSSLTVEDADRLAESFTPFWEEDGPDVPVAPIAPVVAPATPALPVVPPPAPPAAGVPVAATQPQAAAARPMNKQTLFGLSPFSLGQGATGSARATPPGPQPVAPAASPQASSVSSASPPVAITEPFPAPAAVPATSSEVPAATAASGSPVLVTQPLPARPEPQSAAVANVGTAPLPPVRAAEMPSVVSTQKLPAIVPERVAPARAQYKQTLVGLPPADMVRAINAGDSEAASSNVAPAPLQQSSAAVPGYAIAYTPKDGPGTPPVVIAPEAQSSPENLAPPPRSQQPPPSEASITGARAAVAANDDVDLELYIPKKSKAPWIAGLVGSAALLVACFVGYRAMYGSANGSGTAATTATVAPAALVPTSRVDEAPIPLPQVSTAQPIEVPHDLHAPTAAPAAAPMPPTTDAPAPHSPVRSSAPKSKPRAPVTVPAPRPVVRSPAPPTPAPAPAPAPAKTGGKGVIVRDAPF